MFCGGAAKRCVCFANGAKAQEMCPAVPNIACGERDACSRAAKRGVCFANVNYFACGKTMINNCKCKNK